jgi:hypothetical protein
VIPTADIASNSAPATRPTAPDRMPDARRASLVLAIGNHRSGHRGFPHYWASSPAS